MELDIPGTGEFSFLDEDVEMSDDELEKELKELEQEDEKLKENKNQCRAEGILVGEKISSSHLEDEKKVDTSKILEPSHSSNYSQRYKKRNGNHTRRYYEYDSHKKIRFSELTQKLDLDKNDPKKSGREIAFRLKEPKKELFGHIVRVLGVTIANDIYQDTVNSILQGGIKTDSGDRIRSPGGTFLYFMKSRGYATKAQVKEIFKEEENAKKEHRRKLKRELAVRSKYAKDNGEETTKKSEKDIGNSDEK